MAEVDVSLRIAESLAAVGKFEEALEYYKEAELNDPDLLFRYGFIAYQSKRMAIAIHTWEELIKQDSEYASGYNYLRSEEHTSELQSRGHLVCRLLFETKQY